MKLPYEKIHDTVAIVGMAATSRHLAPWKDESIDIFALNNAHEIECFTRATVWFDIHQSWEMTRANTRYSENHYNWLKQEHPFPILVKEWVPKWLFPSTERFPLEEIIFKFGAYFTSSLPYMMAYAIHAGYKTIQLFGVEMSSDSEYAYQRPCMEYWLGIAKGMGIKVDLPADCSLLRGDLYGFEDASIAHRTFYEFRRRDLLKQVAENEKLAWEAQGSLKAAQGLFAEMVKDQPEIPAQWLAAKVQEADENFFEVTKTLEHMRGSLDEMTFLMNWTDKQNRPADRLFVEEKKDEQTPTSA